MTPRESDPAHYLFRDFTVPAQSAPRRPGTITFHDGPIAEIGSTSFTFCDGYQTHTMSLDPSETAEQIAARMRTLIGERARP